jgi:hypothetical protein
MSTWSVVDVACPACATRVELPVARGVHASRAPRWREAALDGTLHHVRCGGCGTEIDVRTPFLFTDMSRAQWVHVDVPGALPRWREVEAAALAGFATWSRTSPLFAERAATLKVRIVFGVEELREKLLAWDAYGDDARIECAKLAMLRQRPDVRRPGERLRVDAITDGDLQMRAVAADEPRRARAGWTTPAAVVAHLDLAAWRAELPELFERGFVSIDRWLAETS